MSSDIDITVSLAETDATYGDLRDAVSSLTADDVSKSSPVTPGGREIGIDVNTQADEAHLRVQGRDGNFTKTTQDAIVSTVREVVGEDAEITVDGGYEGAGSTSEEVTEEEADDDTEAEDDTEDDTDTEEESDDEASEADDEEDGGTSLLGQDYGSEE